MVGLIIRCLILRFEEILADFRHYKANNNAVESIKFLNILKNKFPENIVVLNEITDFAVHLKQAHKAITHISPIYVAEKSDFHKRAHMANMLMRCYASQTKWKYANYFNDRVILDLVSYSTVGKSPTKMPMDAEANIPFSSGLATSAVLKLLAQANDKNLAIFPMFGTLLGIERDRELMRHDRDVDLAIFKNDYDRTFAWLRENGFIEIKHPHFDTQRTFVDRINHLSFEIHIGEKLGDKLSLGFRNQNVESCWQLPIYIQFPKISITQINGYFIRYPDNVDEVLSSIYGNWQQKNDEWVTLLDYNSEKTSLLKFYVKMNLAKAWLHGHVKKALTIAKKNTREFPDDSVAIEAMLHLEKITSGVKNAK